MPHRSIQVKLIGAHLLFALIMNSMPSLLAVFQQEFALGVFHSSVLPLSLTFSTMVANLFVGFLIGRLGQKAVLLAAVGLQVAGLLLVSLAPGFLLALVGFAGVGLATGAAFTAMTTVYSELPPRYQNFGLYHAFFGIGGILAPVFLSTWLDAGYGYRSLFAIYTTLFALLLILLSGSRAITNLKFREFSAGDMLRVVSRPLILVGVAAFGLYAAIEIAGATWSVSTGMSIFGLASRPANLLLSVFWMVFTFSRILTDAAAARVGALNLVRWCLLLATGALLVWISGVTPYAFVVLGLALGPVFPAFQKHMNALLPRAQRGLFNGLTYLAVGVSSTAFIPLMGAIGEYSLALAYIPLAAAALLMVLAVSLVPRLNANTQLTPGLHSGGYEYS